MTKRKNIFYIMIFLLCLIPFNMINGAGEYNVSVVSSSGQITSIGNYDNYNSALDAMNSYNSNMDNIASIYRNGTMVNTKYGVFKFAGEGTVTFSTDYGNRYIHSKYSSEAVILGYDPATYRVKIKISGVVGYIDQSKGSVQPISYLTTGESSSYDTSKNYVKIIATTSLRLREGPGISYTHVGCSSGVTSCSSGIYVNSGSIYEWLNKGSVTSSDGLEWYQINYNGTIGYVANDPSDPYLNVFNPATGDKRDYVTYYYVNNNGILIHQYYARVASNGIWAISLGKAPNWLKQNKNYYSYDGNYFYDTYAKMVNDYVAGTYDNAINETPYYNYYQYLPSRTQTVYNGANINDYLKRWYSGKINRDDYYSRYYDEALGCYKWQLTWDWDDFASGLSMLYGEGDTFINSQTQYGVNALQTFALSINESNWGRSYISVREYNIFGHNAVDSNPDAYATGYNTVGDGIMAHAYKYISLDYDNPISGSHYYGGHYGNKLSGNNVSYASDAYWGEKMASQYYKFDEWYGYQEFRKNVKIGIKQIASSVPVKREANNSSQTYYNLKNVLDVPVSILDTVHGESINGNDIWYKIQSDVPIDINRNLLDIVSSNYNFETSYAYVHSSYIYVESDAPIISANDINLKVNDTFNNQVSAWDAWDGYVNVQTINNNVNTSVPGIYNITYKATDSENNTSEKTINVTVLPNSNPVITASDITIEQFSDFDPLNNVTANDYEDGNITSNIIVMTNTVDTNIIGEYKVVYAITDSNNITVTKEIKVTVKEIEYIKYDNESYFEYLKDENGLSIKGFISITNFDNNLSKDIKYKLLLKNGSSVYEKELFRIISIDEMPFELNENNKYSWFKGNVDLSDIPNGDYTLYIKAICGNIYTETPFSNVFGKTMVTNININNKEIFVRNNFESREAAIQLFIRDTSIGSKNSNARYNILNDYYTINFNENKLNIRGTSHIIGGDYSSSTDVTRTLTFENIATFERYAYDIGSITDGDYTVELRVSDGKDKTKAWFNTDIDLTNIPVGVYSIYISTLSNLSDFGELQDIFSRNISNTKIINNKKYSFTVDKTNRYRILMIVDDV